MVGLAAAGVTAAAGIAAAGIAAAGTAAATVVATAVATAADTTRQRLTYAATDPAQLGPEVRVAPAVRAATTNTTANTLHTTPQES